MMLSCNAHVDIVGTGAAVTGGITTATSKVSAAITAAGLTPVRGCQLACGNCAHKTSRSRCQDLSSDSVVIQRFRLLITAAPVNAKSNVNRITAHSKRVGTDVAEVGAARVSELVMVQLPPSATFAQLVWFAV